MLTGDYAAAIKPDVQCSELDRYEVAALPTRVSESEDRVIKHQRVRIAMCHLRHMDHPSKRGPEPMTAEEAGFVPDTPIKTPPAKPCDSRACVRACLCRGCCAATATAAAADQHGI